MKRFEYSVKGEPRGISYLRVAHLLLLHRRRWGTHWCREILSLHPWLVNLEEQKNEMKTIGMCFELPHKRIP